MKFPPWWGYGDFLELHIKTVMHVVMESIQIQPRQLQVQKSNSIQFLRGSTERCLQLRQAKCTPLEYNNELIIQNLNPKSISRMHSFY